MSSLIHEWGKAILAFYGSAPWTFILAPFLLGLVFGLAVAFRVRRDRTLEWCGSGIRILLYGAAVAALVMIALALAHSYGSPWSGVLYFSACLVVLFVDGTAAAAAVAAIWHWKTTGQSSNRLSGMLSRQQTTWAARCAVASIFVMAGLLKLVARDSLVLFHESGFSTGFWYFIAIWELVWGSAAMFRRALYPALAALGIEMLGGVYTFYHDHFVHGATNPLLNSIDSLRMLGLLAVIAYFVQRGDLERQCETPRSKR